MNFTSKSTDYLLEIQNKSVDDDYIAVNLTVHYYDDDTLAIPEWNIDIDDNDAQKYNEFIEKTGLELDLLYLVLDKPDPVKDKLSEIYDIEINEA